MNAADFNAAATFIAANARILDRCRFQRLFGDDAAQPVRDAVAAYRNDDGGFGHALEGQGGGVSPDKPESGVHAT